MPAKKVKFRNDVRSAKTSRPTSIPKHRANQQSTRNLHVSCLRCSVLANPARLSWPRCWTEDTRVSAPAVSSARHFTSILNGLLATRSTKIHTGLQPQLCFFACTNLTPKPGNLQQRSLELFPISAVCDSDCAGAHGTWHIAQCKIIKSKFVSCESCQASVSHSRWFQSQSEEP